jgi:hypothetical protein
MQIKVEMFHGKRGLLRLAPSWRLLTDRLVNRRHFHCVEWYVALAETFEAHSAAGNQVCFGVFSSNALLAVFPFQVVLIDIAGTKLRALQLLSDAWDAQTARDFIMAPSLANSDFFQNYVQFLDQNDASWDVISLRGILDDSHAALALKSSPNLSIITTPGGAWGRIEFVSCGNESRPFDRLSKGFRQNLRTAHNKLGTTKVNFCSGRNPNDLLDLYPEFLQVETSGWKGAEGTSVLKLPVADSFLRNLISNFGPVSGCEIHLMKIEERTIAALFCILVNDICYILKTGYDEAFGKLSPGHLIVEHLLQKKGIAGTLKVVTPYNAPPWFKAWNPDTVMGIHNAYVFRPSRRGYELAHQIHSRLNRAKPVIG